MATAKVIELNDNNWCKLCENALGKYTCPRCNILYCSMTCYQSESHLQCSEPFYRECVERDLLDDPNVNGSKEKMTEILDRLHRNETLPQPSDDLDSDDEEETDLAKRLEGVDLDDVKQVWDKLTSDERQDFEAYVKSGDISKFVPQWTAWWEFHSDDLVLEMDDVVDYEAKCPKVKDDVAEFVALTKKKPADCVHHNVANVLAGYAYVVRYFNGDHFDFAKEAVSSCAALSKCLSSNHNFGDFETAVKAVEQECHNSKWIFGDQENMDAMKRDVESIFKGPELCRPRFYVQAALSDFHRLLNEAKKKKAQPTEKREALPDLGPQFSYLSAPAVKNKQINLYLKKIEYFLSYIKHCYE